MGGRIAVENPAKDEEIFDCSYRGLEELKTIFIKATIAYLSDLSAKDLSKALLVNEGILSDAHSATPQVDEVTTITNYRLRIDAALNLLPSWCREQTGDGEMDWAGLGIGWPRNVTTTDFRDLLYPRQVEKPVPIADSILGPDVQLALGSLDALNLPYRMERIPKTMPPVLSELNLKGLHHYVAHGDSFSYEQSQDIVAFLDKMKPYLKFGPNWGTQNGPIGEQLRTVFIACEQDGKVRIG